MRQSILIVVLIFSFAVAAVAQQPAKKPAAAKPVKDTLPGRTVTVTSAFQPSLKTTSKINFSAATPQPDTSRRVQPYDVPAQNLVFVYQAPPLKPLAQEIDTGLHWANKGFVKAGYGNFTTPYLQAGVSLGDGQHSVINIHGRHTSSKGQMPYQQFSKSGLEGIGIFATKDNMNEWMGRLFYDNNMQYQYGYQPDTLSFSKDDLRQRFTTFGGKVSLRNKTENAAGLSYNPSLSLNLFSDNHGSSESNFVLNAPVSKSIVKIFSFDLGLTADITTYKSDSAGTVNNNLYTLTPALVFKTPNFKLVTGITPSWDNEIFAMLPNFSAEVRLKNEKFILQAGWVGYFNKTTYQYLAGVNPWLQQPRFLLNTRFKDLYAGFKGSAGSHFTYNASVTYQQIANQPLFVNDTITGRSFEMVNETQMKNLRIHGEIGYTLQEKLSLLAGATFNQYSALSENEKAWGLLPIEINGTLRWQVLKDFIVKSDVFFWDGAQYRGKNLESYKLDPALDVNLGVEFTITPKLNAWLQFNNLFNNRYQRWNQYPVLGFNVLAGVAYSFGDIKQAISSATAK